MRKKRSPAFTRIRVNGVEWRVPRGFGRLYAELAHEQMRLFRAHKPAEMIERVLVTLRRIGYEASRHHVAMDWDLRRRIEAIAYASIEHARAGGNPIRRHPRPSWLTANPWQGPEVGAGAFRGPSGTVIE